MSIFGNVAEIAAEPMEELAETASLRDAGTTAGIATDKLLALSSNPQANQQHLHEHLQPVVLIGQFNQMIVQLPPPLTTHSDRTDRRLCGKKSPGKKRRRARGQRRINKRLAMVSPLAAGVAFQLVLVIAICEDRSPVKPLSRSPHLNTLSGSLSHRPPVPDNGSCYPLPIPCRCS